MTFRGEKLLRIISSVIQVYPWPSIHLLLYSNLHGLTVWRNRQSQIRSKYLVFVPLTLGLYIMRGLLHHFPCHQTHLFLQSHHQAIPYAKNLNMWWDLKPWHRWWSVFCMGEIAQNDINFLTSLINLWSSLRKLSACQRNKWSQQQWMKYSGTPENGLPLLRKPPQCGQESAVPNYSLYYSVQYQETSVLRTPPK